MTGPIRRVVIVGGGTAGWMTAAAMERLTDAGMSVTLVESEEIGTVGVGEATIPSILDFNRWIGIDEDAFVRATGATFKLGIEFVDWARKGDRYLHPFGILGRDVQGVKFHQLWLRQSRLTGAEADVGALDDYCLSAVAARLGRFTRPNANPASVLSSLSYAFHFDASLYARFLRGIAEERGVVRREGRIERVDIDPENGFVRAVILATGERIEGDLFIDCSGFRALLIGDALGVPYVSWQHWLPCDRAVAVPSTSPGAPLPYTRASAEDAGWRWRIPLQHRVGNGHVYASAFTSDEAAAQAVLAGLDGPALAEPSQLRFTAGVRERLWERNCIAIGLSGGFLEPLESTSIHLIQSGISRLMALFPGDMASPVEQTQYNRLMRTEYEQVRDFIILHYHATTRDDSEFWNHCRTMTVPTTLSDKIALWRGRGRVIRDQGGLFTEDSWIAVLMGQVLQPASHDPLVEALPIEGSGNFLRHLRGVINQTAQAMPTHADFIAQNCASPQAA
ncbi:tryptophan 7-halogenase [Sphingobium sp. AS12]|uniref:tryptophan halogenase family protein n=1 Tax=Sphingobium sp. AS12 TaxID=2849495 RepID=UPI001C31D9BD|nr:tryptophan halogenase family protein [Sphingobium sp. AS12]MBV2150723.1 tryptophan 7-halogenase [Sphingobium sp. AS12]